MGAPVVDAAVLKRAVGDDLDAEDGAWRGRERVSHGQGGEFERRGRGRRTCDGKDLLEHVLCDAGREVADVEVGALGGFAAGPRRELMGAGERRSVEGRGAVAEGGARGGGLTAGRKRVQSRLGRRPSWEVRSS